MALNDGISVTQGNVSPDGATSSHLCHAHEWPGASRFCTVNVVIAQGAMQRLTSQRLTSLAASVDENYDLVNAPTVVDVDA